MTRSSTSKTKVSQRCLTHIVISVSHNRDTVSKPSEDRTYTGFLNSRTRVLISTEYDSRSAGTQILLSRFRLPRLM